MGITISHKIGIKSRKNVDNIIEGLEKVSKYYQQEAKRNGVAFEMIKENPTCIIFNIGNCETLAFDFKTAKQINEQAKDGWDYEHSVLTDDGKYPPQAGYEIETYPQNEMFYSAGFCKTQFSKDLWEHVAVAELIRFVASKAKYADIDDEGGYYYSGKIQDAGDAIAENGAIINAMSAQLSDLGYTVVKAQ